MRLILLLVLAPSAFAFLPCSPPPRSCSLLAASTSTTELSNGLVKTVSTPGDDNNPLQLGDIATVKYSCYLPDQAAFCKSPRQKVVVGDNSMIAGWDQALRTMSVGERSIIRITDPSLGYGSAGVPPLVPPNAVIEVDLQVLDAQPATANIDFDTLAMDSTPRTASEIAAAFEIRQKAKAQEPELEGLEAFIAKAKNFYFFGLFEGETGERPPWILRPSITFPLAFLILGAAFYVSYIGGAISERGAQVTDELDEIIVSSNMLLNNPAAVVATLSAFLPNGVGELGL